MEAIRVLRWTTLMVAVLVSALMGPPSALAQDAFPSRPIKLIYAFGAGTNVHSSVLLLAQEASRYLGQPVVVEVRPGAGGRIGLETMMRAKPDGYTLSQPSLASLVLQGAVVPKLRIEPGRDYTPIILTTDIPFVVVASPTAPFRDFKGFVAHAKSNPGKLNVAGGSLYSDSYFAMLQLKVLTGIDFLLVPFKSSLDGIPAQLDGTMDVSVFNGAVKQHIDSGRMIGLATTGVERWDLFPNLPTIRETGIDLTFRTASGVIGPAGMPEAVVKRLHDAFQRAVSDPAVKQRLIDFGMVPRGSTPEEYGQMIRKELDYWTPVVQKLGIKPEG